MGVSDDREYDKHWDRPGGEVLRAMWGGQLHQLGFQYGWDDEINPPRSPEKSWIQGYWDGWVACIEAMVSMRHPEEFEDPEYALVRHEDWATSGRWEAGDGPTRV